MALGAQAGQATGGFRQVRRVAETALNMVLEVRP